MNCRCLGIVALIVGMASTALAQQLDDPFAPLASPKSDRMKSVEIEPLSLDPLLPSDSPKASTTVPAIAVNSSIGSPEMKDWLKKLIQQNLPPSYEDNRKWNKQKEVFSGVHVKLDGLKLETHRNRKLVNAGTWTRYEITFVEPEKNLQVDFTRLEVINNDTIAFETIIITPLDIEGQLAEWARDVKLFSITAHADAKAKLILAGKVKFRLNVLKLPPDVTIVPKIDHASVDLLEYRLRKLSRIDGDAAKLLGKGMRGAIDDKIDDVNETLAAKINRQLEKRKEKLTFSAQDWLLSKLPMPTVKDDSPEEISK